MNAIQSFVLISLVGILISLNFRFLDGFGSYTYYLDLNTIAIVVSIALSTALIIHAINEKK